MGVRVKFAVGEVYHVYNRGVEKRVIFENKHDYQRFLLLMLLANDTQMVDMYSSIRDHSIPELMALQREPIVSIGALSLMPNHYHLLISELTDGGIVSFMRKIGTGYSMYFNVKNDRSGTLFQGRYKAKHIDNDRYLRYMYEYIHLNPIREHFDSSNQVETKKLIEQAEKDPFTSLSVYAGNEEGRLTGAVLTQSMFRNLCSYKEHSESLRKWKDDYEGGPSSLISAVRGVGV